MFLAGLLIIDLHQALVGSVAVFLMFCGAYGVCIVDQSLSLVILHLNKKLITITVFL